MAWWQVGSSAPLWIQSSTQTQWQLLIRRFVVAKMVMKAFEAQRCLVAYPASAGSLRRLVMELVRVQIQLPPKSPQNLQKVLVGA